MNHLLRFLSSGDSQVFEDNEDEDGVEGTMVFSEDLGNGISISDPDAYSDSSTIEVKIELVDENDDPVVDRGTFSFLLDGVTVLDPAGSDGQNVATITFRGTLVATTHPLMS